MYTDKRFYERMITSEKIHLKLEKNYWYFLLTFFINFLMETLIKSIIDWKTVPLERLLMYVVKIVLQPSLFSFLTWGSLAMFCLDQ